MWIQDNFVIILSNLYEFISNPLLAEDVFPENGLLR